MASGIVAVTFLALAATILLGFAALRIFQITRFPDVPILLAVGLLLGPLNTVFGPSWTRGLIDIQGVRSIAPLISNMALLLILFDSGLKLEFSQFGRSFRPAVLHTLPIFLGTVGAISLVAYHVMGMPVLVAVVLAVALSNVGQTVSASIIRQIDLSAEVRSMYFVEMALYDLISIPILVGLLQFAQGVSPDTGAFLRGLARVGAISIILGVTAGIVWLYIFDRLEHHAYSYMITFATLLLLWAVTAYLDGSGPVAVLIFGLLVGNRKSVMRMLDLKGTPAAEGEKIHEFHDEITFFVRAFYFLFLGITFSTGADVARWAVESRLLPLKFLDHTAALFLVAVGLIVVAIVGVRWVMVRYLSARNKPSRRALFAVFGRGLGTAVLATFAFSQPQYQPGEHFHDVFSPWEPIFTNTALLIVLMTVMGTALVVWVSEREGQKDGARGTRGTS